MPEITLIAAAAENNALGREGDLPWHLPDDFKHFKALTTGHAIIMGRKTFETFPKLLPNREHIILTRQKDYHPKGAKVAYTLEEALKIAENDPQPYIIGGGEIFKISVDIADKIELTRVHATLKADAYFPELDYDKWKLAASTFHEKDKKHKFSFTFETYVRI